MFWNELHFPSFSLTASYGIPICTFIAAYAISINTPRSNGSLMWVNWGDYHLSTSISHGLARRIGCLGLSFASVLFLFVVLQKVAFMRSLLGQYVSYEKEKRLSQLGYLQSFGIASSVFMIFVCSFPESEGLILHLFFALLYFGSNMTYQYFHIKLDEAFNLHLEEPRSHRLRQICFVVSVSCLIGVIVSLVGFNNMTISSGLEIIMATFMLCFYISLHNQYSKIEVIVIATSYNSEKKYTTLSNKLLDN